VGEILGLGKGEKGTIERWSLKSIVLAIISVLGFYFGIPEYIFDIRPRFAVTLGSDAVSFIEGALLGAMTTILALKLYSQKTYQPIIKGSSQGKEVLPVHIITVVKDNYQPLHVEMKRNSSLLDNFLDKPFVNFSFPQLEAIYDKGLERFIRKHHKDLFSAIDSFKNNVLPKFKELLSLKTESVKKVFDIWSSYLRKSLPEADSPRTDIFIRIASDLLTTINPYNVLPLLLNESDEKVRFKIEGCILDRTSHIRKKVAERPFVIRRQPKVISHSEISQVLLDKAKPEIAKIVELHKELKEQNDNEVKEKLLPLLKKYISNPI